MQALWEQSWGTQSLVWCLRDGEEGADLSRWGELWGPGNEPGIWRVGRRSWAFQIPGTELPRSSEFTSACFPCHSASWDVQAPPKSLVLLFAPASQGVLSGSLQICPQWTPTLVDSLDSSLTASFYLPGCGCVLSHLWAVPWQSNFSWA